MQSPTGEIHHVVGVEDRAPVVHLERVRELQTEGEIVSGCHSSEVVEHRYGVDVLQVVAKRLVGDWNIVKTEVVVDDSAYPVGTKQGRIAFHRGVELPLVEQVLGDPFDLVRRAAVHRRKCDGVGDFGRDVEIPNLGIPLCDDFDVGREVGRSVTHGVEEPLHVRLQNPFEVVADAHVEDHPGSIARESKLVVQSVDEYPGPQVLIERFVYLEFLRPLDVVALVLNIYARLVDVQFVERLHRLEFDEPCTDQP